MTFAKGSRALLAAAAFVSVQGVPSSAEPPPAAPPVVPPAPPPGPRERPPAGAVPLPLKGRVTVRNEGKVYYVDGPQVVPTGAAIRLEQDVKCVGINRASLDVQGGFEVHGTMDRWAFLEGIDFGKTRRPETNFHFDMTDFQRCSFVHGESDSFEGQMTIENCCLQGGCSFAMRIAGGFVRIMTTEFMGPCRIDVLPGKGKPPEIAIRSSWMKRVTFSGRAAATLRNMEMREGLEAKAFTDLVVDGCDVWGGLSFTQAPGESFSKLDLVKCNLFAGATVTLARPAGDKPAVEKVKLERFYYEKADGVPVLKDKEVAEFVHDGADDPNVSVKAYWSKPNERAHDFVSKSLRSRAPPSRY